MNAKQKYLYDLTGYLHLKNVLEIDELSNAQAAIDRLLEMPSDTVSYTHLTLPTILLV